MLSGSSGIFRRHRLRGLRWQALLCHRHQSSLFGVPMLACLRGSRLEPSTELNCPPLIASARDPIAPRRRGRAFCTAGYSICVATWLLLALARLPVGGDSCPVQPALLALLCILQCCASRALLRAAARPRSHSPKTLRVPCGPVRPLGRLRRLRWGRDVCRHVQPRAKAMALQHGLCKTGFAAFAA